MARRTAPPAVRTPLAAPAHPTQPVHPTGPCKWACASALLLLASPWALAGPAAPLADPTRPPAAFSAGPAAAGRGAAPAGLAAGPRAAEPAPAAPPPAPLPTLQGLHLPARGPALALVDGQLLQLGDRIAGRTVVAIDPQGVVLRGHGSDDRLTLLAGAPKQAPGSLQLTRATRYEPGPAEPLPPAETSPPARTDLATRGARAAAGPLPPAFPVPAGPLSLAGKTAP